MDPKNRKSEENSCNQQLAAAKEAEVTRQAELAALVQAAKEEFPLISY